MLVVRVVILGSCRGKCEGCAGMRTGIGTGSSQGLCWELILWGAWELETLSLSLL